MTPEQIIKGFQKYTCPILMTFSSDTVIIANHPEILQQMTAYDRTRLTNWITNKKECPITCLRLEPASVNLISIQMEVTMFLLEAEKHLGEWLIPDEGIVKEITDFLSLLRADQSNQPLIEEATENLRKLANDENVPLSIQSIERLTSVGVPGDCSKQDLYSQINSQAAHAEHKRCADTANILREARVRREDLERDVAEEQTRTRAAELRLREARARREEMERDVAEEQERLRAAEPRLRQGQASSKGKASSSTQKPASQAVVDLAALLSSNQTPSFFQDYALEEANNKILKKMLGSFIDYKNFFPCNTRK